MYLLLLLLRLKLRFLLLCNISMVYNKRKLQYIRKVIVVSPLSIYLHCICTNADRPN